MYNLKIVLAVMDGILSGVDCSRREDGWKRCSALGNLLHLQVWQGSTISAEVQIGTCRGQVLLQALQSLKLKPDDLRSFRRQATTMKSIWSIVFLGNWSHVPTPVFFHADSISESFCYQKKKIPESFCCGKYSLDAIPNPEFHSKVKILVSAAG